MSQLQIMMLAHHNLGLKNQISKRQDQISNQNHGRAKHSLSLRSFTYKYSIIPALYTVVGKGGVHHCG